MGIKIGKSTRHQDNTFLEKQFNKQLLLFPKGNRRKNKR